MHLVYIDESYGAKTSVISALVVPVELWGDILGVVRQFRGELRKSDGIYVREELHATKFVNGRGHLGRTVVTKSRRWELYKATLGFIATLPDVKLLNAVGPRGRELQIFERLLNRLHRTLEKNDSQAMLVCDIGHEKEYTRLTRRLRVYNHVSSSRGIWPDGKATRNIPLKRLVEDPIFRDSEESYFIQLVDFCAYAVLRREEPLPAKSAFGLDQAFLLLKPILVTEANRNDTYGVIRL